MESRNSVSVAMGSRAGDVEAAATAADGEEVVALASSVVFAPSEHPGTAREARHTATQNRLLLPRTGGSLSREVERPALDIFTFQSDALRH